MRRWAARLHGLLVPVAEREGGERLRRVPSHDEVGRLLEHRELSRHGARARGQPSWSPRVRAPDRLTSCGTKPACSTVVAISWLAHRQATAYTAGRIELLLLLLSCASEAEVEAEAEAEAGGGGGQAVCWRGQGGGDQDSPARACGPAAAARAAAPRPPVRRGSCSSRAGWRAPPRPRAAAAPSRSRAWCTAAGRSAPSGRAGPGERPPQDGGARQSGWPARRSPAAGSRCPWPGPSERVARGRSRAGRPGAQSRPSRRPPKGSLDSWLSAAASLRHQGCQAAPLVASPLAWRPTRVAACA